MLSVFDTEVGGSFAVFASARDVTVELHATSGDRLWYCEDILALQSANRSTDGAHSLQSKLLCALNQTTDDGPEGLNCSQFSVQLAVDSSGKLELTVKGRISSTSTMMERLYKGLVPQSYGTGAGLMKLLRCVSSRMAEDAQAIKLRDQSLSQYSKQLRACTEQYRVLVVEKEQFQDDLVRSMCMLLNSKKRHTHDVYDVDSGDEVSRGSDNGEEAVEEVESDGGEVNSSPDEGVKRMRIVPASTGSGNLKRASSWASDEMDEAAPSAPSTAPPAAASPPTSAGQPKKQKSQGFLAEDSDDSDDADTNALDYM
ncbi:hypothetical protein B484DRAFT_445937 [Ochromonadaceae sp. CCMP2298]|nr:hypothetical protein B484DRAFT_445937 [Ochromonadaceae sp. CCMP2298]